jgi:hypothetical protein
MAKSAETPNAQQRMLGAVFGEPDAGRGPSAWGGNSHHLHDRAVWRRAARCGWCGLPRLR